MSIPNPRPEEGASCGFAGLSFYALGLTALMPVLLALHSGGELVFSRRTAFTKMVHGFYRLTALAFDAKRKREVASG